MKIAIVRERADGETRVAATPETVQKLSALGGSVVIESGAGMLARFPDEDYAKAGATVAASAADAVAGAEVVLGVRRPSVDILRGVAPGALVIATLDPYGNERDIDALAKAGVTAVAMEFMPRITRAQVMDVLSSQANLAGYQAVIDAAAAFDRAFPMMMTAAGTMPSGQGLRDGRGRCGAAGHRNREAPWRGGVGHRRARRSGRAGRVARREVHHDRRAEGRRDGTGGYARELTDAEKAAQAELTASHIAKQDIVITTALIPGRPAPKLVSKAMVESMAPGR
jgi:NAD(P) transhydrogenase subunit alpha